MPSARSTPTPPSAGASEPSSAVAGASEPQRPLRADARRNRERLLAAADAVFTERGADASLEDVARRAGVGIGTLYRHFPTREALLVATVEDQLHALARKTQALAGSASPGDALSEFIAAFVEHASTYRGLAASLGVAFHGGSPACCAASEAASHLLSLAQAAGEIRRDIDLDDIVSLVTAIALAAQQPPEGPARAQRLLATFLAGLRTASAPPQAPASPKRARKGAAAPAAGRGGAAASPGSSGERRRAVRRR
ncbi:TetR/AcrR family transcriptional regulator [Sorangium sp. So ce542]|uniref:TetR/AcrR family transcriptional regulator n=1 Tax=Sorangium sp. So ce542 TaxID=3133316 RepID=UPI003F61C65F